MKNEMCPKCGGLIAEPNKVYGWAGKWCYCSSDTAKEMFGNPGWICPKCQSVWSPFTSTCLNCAPGKKITSSKTTT